MHAVGVEVIRVKKIVKSKEAIAAHSISMPDPHKRCRSSDYELHLVDYQVSFQNT